MQRLQGWAEQGNKSVIEDSSLDARLVQGSFPGCTVTIFNKGLATMPICYASDDLTNAKSNPFTADVNGYWYAYVANGRYDVQFSGTGITTPFTVGDVIANDPGPEVVYNVIERGAKGDGSTDDVAIINSVITGAYAAGGGIVFFPVGNYRVTAPVVLQNVHGITLQGTGPGSVITADFAGNTIYINGTGGSGGVAGIRIKDLFVSGNNAHVSTAIDIRNCIDFTLSNVIAYGWDPAGAGGAKGIIIRGSGFGTLDNVQGYVGGSPASPSTDVALDLGDTTGGLTCTGPLDIRLSIFGESVQALRLHGNYVSVVFTACMFSTAGQLTTVSIDSDAAFSSVQFEQCYGESNWDTTNNGQDILIGAASKAATVNVNGWTSWGHGDGTHYRKYWMRVVACTSLEVDGVMVSKLNYTHGYDSGAIRLDSGCPASGDRLNVASMNITTVSGPMYSDGNSKIPSGYLGDIIDRTITLVGTASYTSGAIADKASASTSVTVTGAALGDSATCSHDHDLTGLFISGFVSGTDTAKVIFGNLSGAPVTPSSGTVTALVKKII